MATTLLIIRMWNNDEEFNSNIHMIDHDSVVTKDNHRYTVGEVEYVKIDKKPEKKEIEKNYIGVTMPHRI